MKLRMLPSEATGESETMKPKTAKPECYGKMFPDLSQIEFNTPHGGKAFTVLLESSDRGVTDRRSSGDVKEWEPCTDGPAYDCCYDLCVARTLLDPSAQGYGMARAL